MRVRWLDSAYAEAQSIFDNIATDNRLAADRWADAIADKAAALADAPYLGAPLERYRNARYLTHGNYVIYYTVHPREVSRGEWSDAVPAQVAAAGRVITRPAV